MTGPMAMTWYLEELRQLWLKQHGIQHPFYTQDGYEQLMQNKTSLPGAAIGLSGVNRPDILKTRKDYPNVPVMVVNSIRLADTR